MTDSQKRELYVALTVFLENQRLDLVVAGDRDELIPLSQNFDIFEWLPNSELAILPGQNHSEPLFEPGKFMAAIVEFVGRL